MGPGKDPKPDRDEMTRELARLVLGLKADLDAQAHDRRRGERPTIALRASTGGWVRMRELAEQLLGVDGG